MTRTSRSRALVSLLPASSPATSRSVFFETLLVDLPPCSRMNSLISSRVNCVRVPVTTTVIPSNGRATAVAGSGTGLPWLRPSSRRSSTTARLIGEWKNWWTLSAITGPISSTSDSCSTDWPPTVSIVPNRSVNTRALVPPTWRIFNPVNSRHNGRVLEPSIASSRLSTDFSPIRSISINVSR